MKMFVNDDRIDLFDERFYKAGVDKTNEVIWYPSVTHILGEVHPKGQFFEQWLKDVGNNAKVISEIAAEKGSIVHSLVERLSSGEEIHIKDSKIVDIDLKYRSDTLTFDEYKACLKFQDFWEEFMEKFIDKEFTILSHKGKYAGTGDFLCKIDGEVWLIDHKYGNAVYDAYWYQLQAYREGLAEMGIKVDKVGILHLKAKTRGRSKTKGVIQGSGWKLETPPQKQEYYSKIWNNYLEIYYLVNKDKPKFMELPSKIKLTKKWD